MKQTIEIEVPDDKKAVWKGGRVIFEDIKSQLPKTWKEFCENHVQDEEYMSLGGTLNNERMEHAKLQKEYAKLKKEYAKMEEENARLNKQMSYLQEAMSWA